MAEAPPPQFGPTEQEMLRGAIQVIVIEDLLAMLRKDREAMHKAKSAPPTLCTSHSGLDAVIFYINTLGRRVSETARG